MSGFSKNEALVFTFRVTAQFVLIIIGFRFLYDIASPVIFISGFAAAAVGGFLGGRSSLRFVSALLGAGALFFIIRFIYIFISDRFAAASLNPAYDFGGIFFDSSFIPLFIPMLYIWAGGFLSSRGRIFLILELAANSLILSALLWSQAGYRLTIFPHQGYLALICVIYIIAEVLVIVFSGPEGETAFIQRFLPFLLTVIPAIILVLFLILGSYSDGAAREGGGLMKPTLFRFDFSDYVKLESEISMNTDLVMLFRNYGYLNSVYLRRYYLSGYREERGFYIQTGPGEQEQLTVLPDRPSVTNAERYPKRITAEQEYFILNFDPSSLIAINYPVEITPLTNWDGSSFLRNYRAVSDAIELPSWDLMDAGMLPMSDRLYSFYTEYGDDEAIRELAEEVTEGLDLYYDKVMAIMYYLRDNYYYSLKPGVAVDGNQLDYFLFDSKKGYCSYFAFSMALMCRSLGIPARVAAGFYIDPQSGILNVYPVRADMAHAWVEVPFEQFGWVEFDPTSETVAPGEELEFCSINPDEYSSYVEEIFENEYSLAESPDDEPDAADTHGLSLQAVIRYAAAKWPFILAGLYIFTVLAVHLSALIRIRFNSCRKKARAVFRRASAWASASGGFRYSDESIHEYAVRTESKTGLCFTVLADSYLSSVFSDSYTDADAEALDSSWKAFRISLKNVSIFKRILFILFPFRRLRSKRITALVLVLAALMLPVSHLEAQDFVDNSPGEQSGAAPDAGWYIDMAGREMDAENYEAALRLLKEGASEYPQSAEIYTELGTLYQDRELYNMSVENYNRALEINPLDSEILYMRSVSEGLLNHDAESTASLEQVLSLDPENFEAIADLGWMYFKTFRLNSAEALLLDAVERFPDSPILYMTLGTVYSGKYDYDNSRLNYQKAIDLALNEGWSYFASVSYYNLSLLEHGFYHYQESMDLTNMSIETSERAPGYIARAELFTRKLDFTNAFLNYQRAYILDSTPLALMGYADLYLTFGLLDEALSHINEVLNRSDDSWMYYFGVDRDRHLMEVDRILAGIYEGLAYRTEGMPETGFALLGKLFQGMKYRMLSWFHDRRYRKASFTVGSQNYAEGNSLDAAWSFYKAAEKYPRKALPYLLQAEKIETAVAPEAEPSYLLEKGRLLSDPVMLSTAAGSFDPDWEKLELSEALTELIPIAEDSGRPEMSDEMAWQLYELNPGIFLKTDLKFPLRLDFEPGFRFRHILTSSGFNILSNKSDIHYRYSLKAADNLTSGRVYQLEDGLSGRILFSIPVETDLSSRRDITAFVKKFKEKLYKISDEADAALPYQ